MTFVVDWVLHLTVFSPNNMTFLVDWGLNFEQCVFRADMTFAVDWALNLIVFFSLRYDLSGC